MDIMKSYSRTSFLGIFCIIILLMLMVDGAFYYGVDVIFSKMTITDDLRFGCLLIGFYAVEDRIPRVYPWMNELHLVSASAEVRSAPQEP